MSKIKSCSEGKVGDKLMFDKSGYSPTITRVEKQPMGGVMYHLEDGGSISTNEGCWKYFTIIEKEK